MVRQADRLRALAVRVARQQRVDVGLCLGQQCLSQIREQRYLLGGTLTEVQQRVGDHLVVAAAPGVEPPAGVADQLGQAPLDRGVDVLVALAEHERARLHLGGDPDEPVVDRRRVLGRDDPLGSQHPGVGPRRGDVLRPQAPVDGQRRVEAVEGLRGAGGEPAAPQADRLGHARRTVARASQTWSTCDSVISGKKGSAIVDALMASVTGNSPGPWPCSSW